MRSKMKVERVELDKVSSREVWVLLLVKSTHGDEYCHGRKSE